MPLYEYECEKCKKAFEVIQKFSDPAEEKCPTCGKVCPRVVSRTSFQLKGTGWYQTDYKSSGSKGSSSGGSGD